MGGDKPKKSIKERLERALEVQTWLISKKKRIIRVFLLLILFFIILDLAIWACYSDSNEFAGTYRLEEKDPEYLLFDYINYVKEYSEEHPDTAIIIFTGESVINANSVKENEYTLPYSYEHYAQEHFGKDKVKVFQLTMSGSYLSDHYMIIKELIDYADVFFVDLHYFFFSYQKFQLAHEPLKDLPSITNEDLAPFNMTTKANKGFENKIFGVVRHWNLVRYSNRIFFRFFKKSPKKFIHSKLLLEKMVDTSDKYKAWEDLSPKTRQYIIDLTDGRYTVIEINNNNPNYIYFKKIINITRQNDKTLIYYTPPYNYWLHNEGIVFLDWETYERQMSLPKRVAEKLEIPCLEYNTEENYRNNRSIVPLSLYHDSDHFVKGGDRMWADIMFNDTKHILEELI